MPRIQLNALSKYFHVFQRKVNINDLNYMSHLDHASVIKIIHEARVDCLRQIGLSERNLMPKKGPFSVQLLIGDISAQYLNNGELFDDLIVESGFGERSRCGFRMCHRIRSLVPIGSSDFPQSIVEHHVGETFHLDQPTGATFKPIALVEVGMVAVDAISKQPIELPSTFFEKLGFSKSELETHLTTMSANGGPFNNNKK
ncbi:hypothetical protein SAMD00019534_044330, partial [Acytostelium subglobosum LB1]|uniref:hypothetical protein n=1 Tax=Acytostelium subglobosum LB1 TaxID=1410327 RepID=UPI0006450F4C